MLVLQEGAAGAVLRGARTTVFRTSAQGAGYRSTANHCSTSNVLAVPRHPKNTPLTPGNYVQLVQYLAVLRCCRCTSAWCVTRCSGRRAPCSATRGRHAPAAAQRAAPAAAGRGRPRYRWLAALCTAQLEIFRIFRTIFWVPLRDNKEACGKH